MSITALQSESFSFNHPLDHAARAIIFITLFLLVSLNITDTFLLIAIVLFYAQSNFKQKIRFALAFCMNYCLIAFITLLIISFFYSAGPWHDRFATFWKYFDKLFFFFFLTPLFLEKRWRNIALVVFLISTFLNLLLWTLSAKQIGLFQHFLQHAPIPHLLRTFATQSFSSTIAIVAYAMLLKIVQSPSHKKRGLYAGLFLISVYYLFFINLERVGMLTALILFCVFIWQHCHRYRAASLVLLCAVCIGLYFASNAVQQRIQEGYKQLTGFPQDMNTSLGIRLENTKDSLLLIQQRPWLGWGVGSYATLTQRYFPQDYSLFKEQKAPENGFLYIAVETGCLGLLMIIGWLTLQWIEAKRYLPLFETRLVHALIIGFVLMSATASQFSSHFELIKQALLISILFGSAFDREAKKIEADL